jgi:flagellar biosynthesis/type III secretory pathway chaperone
VEEIGMENPVALAKTTLDEEVRLIDGLINLAEITRRAVLERSLDQLKLIGARHQTAIVHLEIVRQTQAKLLGRFVAEGVINEGEGLGTLIERHGGPEERRQAARLRERIEELDRRNRQNARLLEKQFVGVKAFQQVLDLVAGVDRVYDRGGTTRRVNRQGLIEESL